MTTQTTIYLHIVEDIIGATVFARTHRNYSTAPRPDQVALASSINRALSFDIGVAVEPNNDRIGNESWWTEFSRRIIHICEKNPLVKTDVSVVETFPQGTARIIKVVAHNNRPKDRFAAPKDMPCIQEFASGDGAHCGLADWYPTKRDALARALEIGKPFDTGWYGSKKEIASARIYSPDGKRVCVEASVSDDFDTDGTGRAEVKGKPTLDKIEDAIYAAWDAAKNDQRDNALYAVE